MSDAVSPTAPLLNRSMKAVILAGGIGTRISEESHLRPKPMIEIGGMPIIWHGDAIGGVGVNNAASISEAFRNRAISKKPRLNITQQGHFLASGQLTHRSLHRGRFFDRRR